MPTGGLYERDRWYYCRASGAGVYRRHVPSSDRIILEMNTGIDKLNDIKAHAERILDEAEGVLEFASAHENLLRDMEEIRVNMVENMDTEMQRETAQYAFDHVWPVIGKIEKRYLDSALDFGDQRIVVPGLQYMRVGQKF